MTGSSEEGWSREWPWQLGGALIPEIQGLLAEKFGYQHSYIIVRLCYVYLFHFAWSGHCVRQPRSPVLPDYAPPPETA